MADAILGLLFENLNSLIQRKFGLLWGVQKEMEKLSSRLSSIQAVLEDAEEKQVKSKAIRDWQSKLKDAAYDADDILDRWSTKSQQVPGCISSYFDFKRHIFRYKIAKRIKDILEKFDEIAKEKNDFNLIERQVNRVNQLDQTRKTTSTVHEPKIYGREADKKNIVNLLLNNVNCESNVCVCPIVGIGGLGKTTLAQIIYNDKEVVRYFEKRMWVCVSEDFNVERLTKSIIESSSGNSCDLSDLDTMQHKLREIVEGKRFLLVLDDVWNDDQDEWNKLESSLICGAKGSAIIVTTRLPRVACITGTIEAYHLNLLSHDDCWNLFSYHAFGMGNEEKPNLAKIGSEIVEKCGGVPLAAKALGSLLRFKSEESEWKLVKDSEIWELEKDEQNNMILPALRLSYNNLSTQLKQCFAYCSIFPKDHQMDKNELIHLWIANGFIQFDGRMELEDMGKEIFNELIGRSLFQGIREYENGSIKLCKMHDLLHDLACSVMGNECLRIEVAEVKTNLFPKKIRHFSFDYNLETICPDWYEHLSSRALCLRTFFCFCYDRPVKLSPHQLSIFSHLNYLRVLNLGFIFMDTLPPSIANLKQLRYLNLANCGLQSLPNWLGCLRNLQMLRLNGNKLETLPPSIAKLEQLRFLDLSSNYKLTFLPEFIGGLRNLHTLKLHFCESLEVLPKSMSNLKNLKHLYNFDCWKLSEMPPDIGRLTSLQTLELFIVSSKPELGMKDLQGLNLLKGSLEIGRLERVGDSMDAKEANLINKENLSHLTLSWSVEDMDENNNDDNDDDDSSEVLESLQPHKNIKGLHINGYPGVKFPDWMKFENPQHSLFSKLTTLSLHDLYNLEELSWNWSKESPSLTALQHLSIKNCRMLKNLPTALVNLTSLRTLFIEKCDSLTSLPRLGMQESISSLVELEIWYCRELEFPAEYFEHLTALQHLRICYCDKLTCLPEGLQHAAALEQLSLVGCKNLNILPDWMQHLSALRNLHIFLCDANLRSRCEKDKGQDWHKISHIPDITIT